MHYICFPVKLSTDITAILENISWRSWIQCALQYLYYICSGTLRCCFARETSVCRQDQSAEDVLRWSLNSESANVLRKRWQPFNSGCERILKAQAVIWSTLWIQLPIMSAEAPTIHSKVLISGTLCKRNLALSGLWHHSTNYSDIFPTSVFSMTGILL